MTDPRFTDPRNDQRANNRLTRGDGALWGWIAAIAVLVLIAFVLIAGWNNTGSNTATNTPTAPVTTPTPTPPPASSTTGSGTTSPQPSPPPASNPPAPKQ